MTLAGSARPAWAGSNPTPSPAETSASIVVNLDLFDFQLRYSITLGRCPDGRLAFLAAEPVVLPLIFRAELAVVTDGHATYRVMGIGGLGFRFLYWGVLLTNIRGVHELTPVRIHG